MYFNSCITGQQKVALNDRRTVWGLPDLEKPSVHVTDLTVGSVRHIHDLVTRRV